MNEEQEDKDLSCDNPNFIRWCLCRFTTIAHFRRFIGTLILLVGVYYLVASGAIPEQWSVFIGIVLGYYFGHNKESM